MGFIMSPFLSPFAFGFMVARMRSVVFHFDICQKLIVHSWRWVYGIGSIYGAVVLALIVFLGEETWVFLTSLRLPVLPVSMLY